MNRLSSQPRAQSNNGRMTPQEYMIHKNIPIPQPAKRCCQDTEAKTHKLDICNGQQSNATSNSEIDRLRKVIEEKNKEIEFLKQTENQSKMFTTQFQEMNQNHQQETKQLLDQIQNYKQRTQDLKSQLELYVLESNKVNQKYQESCRERDEYLKNFREYQQDYDIVRMQLQGKDMEIMTMKERIQAMEKSHLGEMTLLSQNSDHQKRSLMDTQVRDITQQFNQDRMQYEMKIRTLEDKNIAIENQCVLLATEMERTRLTYHKDIEQYKTTMMLLQDENNKLQSEMQQLSEFIERYEEEMNSVGSAEEQHLRDRMRIIVLSTEIERLWTVINTFEMKNESYQSELQVKIEFACTQLKQQLQLEILKSQQYQQDIHQLQLQQDVWERTHLEQEELQNKCAMLTTEVERLNLLIRENESHSLAQQSQIEQLLQKLKYANGQLQSQQTIITKLEMDNSNYQQESMLLNADNDNLAMKIQQLEEETAQQSQESQQYLTKRSQELKSQLDQYTSELNRTLHNYNQVCQDRDEYFSQLQNVIRENEVLHMSVEEKEQNMQNLAEQIELLENKHKIETDELRKQNEFQRRSLLDQQIRELSQKFNNDKAILEGQIRQQQQTKLQLESKNTYLQQELEKIQYLLDDQNDTYRSKLQTSEKERINLLQEIKEYQIQLQITVTENRQLREEIISERMRIVVLASEVDRLWSVIDDFTRNIKNHDEQYLLQNEKIKQFTATQCQYHNTICQLDQEKKDMQLIIQKQSENQGMLSSEYERLRNQLFEETTRCYEYENKQKQLINEIEELYTQVDTYSSELTMISKNGLETSDLETKFQAERMAWETQRYQLMNQLQDCEQKAMHQTQEIRRLNLTAEEKIKEIEQWKTRYMDSQLSSEYEQLKIEFDEQNQQLIELESMNLKLKSNVHSLEKQIQLLELSLQDKTKEVEDVYGLMNKQRRQNDYSNKEAEVNRKTQQQLQQSISNFEGQNQQLREQLQSTINQNQDLIQKISYLESSLYEREQTIQKRTNDLNEKIKEMDLLKTKYEQKMITTTSQIVRNASLTRQVTKTEQENLITESVVKQKQIATIVKPPRQVMSQLNTDFNQHEL